MHIETKSDKAITQESYQATAHMFAKNVAELAPTSSIEKFVKLLPTKAKIIDIGCGSGRDAKIFTDMDIEVLGIDFCTNLIEIAKTNAPLAKFQLMDIENMSLPTTSFDGAWAACSLGHISKKNFPDVLIKTHSLLKDNGYFYLTLKKGKGEILEKDLRYEGDFKKFWSFFELEELRKFLESSHFKILDLNTIEKKHAYQTHSSLRVFCQKTKSNGVRRK